MKMNRFDKTYRMIMEEVAGEGFFDKIKQGAKRGLNKVKRMVGMNKKLDFIEVCPEDGGVDSKDPDVQKFMNELLDHGISIDHSFDEDGVGPWRCYFSANAKKLDEVKEVFKELEANPGLAEKIATKEQLSEIQSRMPDEDYEGYEEQ